MLRLLIVPWLLSTALRSIDQAGKPLKRVYGPENRHCRVGVRKGVSEVIGGELVHNSSKYPFLAWVGDNDGTGLSQFCGGTLIHPSIVLTASHCVFDSTYWNSHIYVRFGLTNFANTTGVARKIINWRRHEKYNRKKVLNDIALLLLERPVTQEGDGIYPVHLSDGSEAHEQTNARVTGWGSTDEDCKMYDTYLRDANVTIGPKGPRCSTPGSKTLTKNDFNPNKQLCAGIYTPGGMMYPGCGDSGGPLLIPNSGSNAEERGPYTQVGLVSWSYGIPWPDVFTRVSYFKDWINKTTADLLAKGAHPKLWVAQ